MDENGEWKVGPLRLPKKPITRSLSSIVAGLRKIEDEALDEELDVLREMEMEEAGIAPPPKKAAPTPTEAEMPVMEDGAEVEDSQIKEAEPRPDRPVLLGGFDDENAYDSSADEQLDRGQPLRVYKKKGQKRTTRRSYLKPTRSKRPVDAAGDEEDDEDVVLETQVKAAGGEEEPVDALMSGSDFDEDESDEDAAEKKNAKAKKDKKAKDKKDKEKKEKGKEKEEGTVKKAVRKVKATAHANFKRLKLRQGGAKGGPAHNSRFRRKR